MKKETVMDAKVKQYSRICEFTNAASKSCDSRNFNYYISNPAADKIAVTYAIKDKDAFWGLHSSVNEQDIVRWLVSVDSPFASRQKLDEKTLELIRDGLWHFRAEYPNATLLEKAMCKRVLLSFAMHFFVYYKCSDAVYEMMKDIWADAEQTPFDYVDINRNLRSYEERNGDILRINGRLPDAVIDALTIRGIRYCIGKEKEQAVVILQEAADGGRPIAELYRHGDLKEVLCCVSPVFYSGAMARIKRIREQSSFGNASVYNYMFELESVSYGTHLGLKDPRMGNSGFFFTEEERMILQNFDRWESMLQEELISKLEEGSAPVEAINAYLAKSGYTHGMNTSSNIITSDGYLVYTKRGSKTFDSETLYCSANGVCEVFDERVSFYHNSVECDLPTIAEIHGFGGFGGELTRESYAELGVYIEPTTWDYYGFSVMGYRSRNRTHRFPLHINILACAPADSTLKQIRKSSTSAVEKEENENVMGISVQVDHNLYEALVTKLRYIFRMLYERKDVFADLLILFTVLSVFRERVTSGSSPWNSLLATVQNFTYMDWISFLTALLTLSFTLIELKDILREAFRKYRKAYSFVLSDSTTQETIIRRCLDKTRKNAGCRKINPIFTLMFQLYFYRSGEDA